MTREEIIRLARESELLTTTGGCQVWMPDNLEAFAALVAAAEREACAKIVEQYCGAWDDAGYALSQAIRARGQE